MNYYTEITLMDGDKLSGDSLWTALYIQLHLALVEAKNQQGRISIGIGFPNYQYNTERKIGLLGEKVRLFAETREQLEKLNLSKYLSRLTDYLHIKSIRAVPDTVSQVCYVRRQPKTEARISKDMRGKAELWSKASGKPLEDCFSELQKSKPVATDCTLPFIWMESQETKQRSPGINAKFPLFIEQIEVEGKQSGKFSCYGLSVSNGDKTQIASVPHF